MEIIIGRQGTQKTPITDPTVSRKHCKVTDNGDGTYTIENLSPSGTKVDGVDILRTTVKPNSRIQLGQSFSATLVELIGIPQEKTESNKQSAQINHSEQASSSPKTQPDVKTFNISHLRRVWEDYNNTNLEMAESQRKTNLVRTGLGIFTMCAMPTIFFFGPVGYILTGIGVLGNIYSFAGMRNAETAEERQRRQDAFDDAWVCPNPDCGHSLLAKNYKLLVRNHQSCPYCKCRYVEK
ncbi:MAG: FHA domain-containing protein [Muribaculaceae bacterium]|nr:FHA domain-containing protein [Muribaculaceae bacterium]